MITQKLFDLSIIAKFILCTKLNKKSPENSGLFSILLKY